MFSIKYIMFVSKIFFFFATVKQMFWITIGLIQLYVLFELNEPLVYVTFFAVKLISDFVKN